MENQIDEKKAIMLMYKEIQKLVKRNEPIEDSESGKILENIIEKIDALAEQKSFTQEQRNVLEQIAKATSQAVKTEIASGNTDMKSDLKTVLEKIGTSSQNPKPMISERKITIDIVSKWTVFIFIGAFAIIAVLSSALYLTTRPNYDRMDNDLKYRYIKMKGEATSASVSDLENLFEIQRDNAKIRQLRRDVEHYEQAVREKATLDEQNRLRQLEVEKLNHKANSIKAK